MKAVQITLPRIASLNVPTTRPADYFAEMAKSDKQMGRVRRQLLEIQKRKQRQEHARRYRVRSNQEILSIFRLRDEKKFAVKVQRTREDRKRKEKNKLMEATKKHKKGMKGQLEDMLKNAKRMQQRDDDDGEVRRIKSAFC
jgi:rRNA-processing protein EBP2